MASTLLKSGVEVASAAVNTAVNAKLNADALEQQIELESAQAAASTVTSAANAGETGRNALFKAMKSGKMKRSRPSGIPQREKKISTGTGVGIVVGGLALAGLAFVLIRRKR